MSKSDAATLPVPYGRAFGLGVACFDCPMEVRVSPERWGEDHLALGREIAALGWRRVRFGSACAGRSFVDLCPACRMNVELPDNQLWAGSR